MIQNLQSELASPEHSPTKTHDFRFSDLSPTKIRLQHSVSNATENQIFSGTFQQMNKKVTIRPCQELKLTIQEALQRVGINGRYQIVCNIFFFFQWLIAGAVLNSPIFLFLKPTFECDNGLNGTECENWVCNQSNPLSFATYIPKSLVMQFDPPLICERQVIADSIIAITYSGSIAGFIISSYISDNKGRKFASLIFWIFAGIGSLLSGVLLQSPWLVAAGLFISTFGVNPVITYVFCFINEHSDGNFREYSLALLNALFAIGAIYLAITQYITDNWIHLQIYFIAIPIIVSNLFYYYIQEPPIFLFQQDKKKAINILNHIAKINKKPQIKEEDLKEEPTSAEQIDQPKSKSQSSGYLDLFKSKSILITTICCSLILFVIQFHLYGTNLTFASIGLEVKINTVIIYSAEAISNLLTGKIFNQIEFFQCEIYEIVYIIPKISRRKNGFLMIASNLVFLLFFFIKLPSDCDGFCTQKIAQIALMGIARFLLGFQINIHQVYISELYPTSIRSIGIGFTSIIGVVGSIICGYFVTFFSVENLNPIGSMGIAGLLACLLNEDLFKFFQQESSKFDKILEDPNLSIENLLDEESIINEFRGCNPRLLQKLKNYDFNKMVKFIIEEPSEQDDQRRQFKYPFISCELLTCNIGTIPEQFFEREPLTIDDEHNDSVENQMLLEEEHSQTQGEQQNGIQIKESLSDTSEEDNEELNKPIGRISMTGDQLNKIEQERMDIEKEEEDTSKHQNNDNQNQDISQEQQQQEQKALQKQQQEQQEDSKNEMDISQEMNISTEQPPQSGKVVEEQITQKADELFSDALLQVQEEKKKQEQLRQELEQKYEKIPQDNMYLFGLLLSFFESNKEVNITLAGYVAKVFLHLFSLAKNKNKEQEIIEYLYKNENNLLNMTKQMQSRSCSDILVKSISFSNLQLKGKFLNIKLKVIDKLIDLLSDENNDLEVFANTVLCFQELISYYTNYTDGKQIVEYVITQPVFGKLLNNLTSQSSKIAYHSASVVCIIVQLFNVIESRRSDEDETSFKEFDIDFNDALQHFSTYIKVTIDYLKNYSQDETIKTVYRQDLKPLGQSRLKIIEIYCVALKLDNFYVVQEMAQHNLHAVLLELFLKYEWNNMLHTLVERIIIQSAQIDSHAMRKAVFTDAKLINFLLEATKQVDSAISNDVPGKVNFRKGYLGHVTKIANFVQRLCENNAEIQEYVDFDLWAELRQNFLDQTNSNNNRELGDHAMIDHDSHQSQAHCSYDFDDIKQKSESFLHGNPQHYEENQLKEEEEHHDQDLENNQDENEKPESDEMFFSNIAKSIQEDDKHEEENRQQDQHLEAFGFNDPFSNYQMTTSQEKTKGFEAFEFFDVQNTNQDNNESQKQEDIFKSFGFTNSPQLSASPNPNEIQNEDHDLNKQTLQQQQQQQQQQQNQDDQQNNTNNKTDFDFFSVS
ncbi:hypothetical protein ABPG74_014153 [Tetrahymena malaccensis]